MVGQLSYGKRQWESLDGEMRRLIPIFDKASKEMTAFVDADTNAFNDYMLAMKMSKNTEGFTFTNYVAF
jgi:glutamate formiminotransferase/formiminotetrahydrofolate cyclodeaminase